MRNYSVLAFLPVIDYFVCWSKRHGHLPEPRLTDIRLGRLAVLKKLRKSETIMKVAQFTDIPGQVFNSEIVKNVTGRVAIGKDDGAPNFCMRVFTIGADGFTPRHSHEWEHEIFVHAGEGQVYRNGEWVDVQAGSTIFVPGNEEHQLRNRGKEDFTFVCLIPKGVTEL